MSFPLRAIIALALAGMYPMGGEPLYFLEPGRDVWLIGGLSLTPAPAVATVAIVLFALWTALHTFLNLRAPERAGPGTWLRARTHGLLPLLIHAALLFLFHFPVWIHEETPLGFAHGTIYLGTLLPYLAMGGIGLLGQFAEERAHRPEAGISTGMRINLSFIMIPVGFVLLLSIGTLQSDSVQYLLLVYPFVPVLISMALAVAFLICAPPMLSLLFGARPLEPGPLRERLESLARKRNFRCRDLLVFGRTGDSFFNALVVGPIPSMRYIFLSRDLVDGLSIREVECVMGHEMAHILLNHLVSFAAAMTGAVLLVTAGADLGSAAGLDAAPAGLIFMALFVAGIVLLGRASRRFESEADLLGAEMVGSEIDCANTLERVTRLGRISLTRGSWRYFPTIRRVAILLQARTLPAFRPAFMRRARRWRTAMFGILAVGIPAFLVAAALQIRSAPERREKWDAYERAGEGLSEVAAGDVARGIQTLEAVVKSGFDEPLIYEALARAYRSQGDIVRAEEHLARARKLKARDPRLRQRLR